MPLITVIGLVAVLVGCAPEEIAPAAKLAPAGSGIEDGNPLPADTETIPIPPELVTDVERDLPGAEVGSLSSQWARVRWQHMFLRVRHVPWNGGLTPTTVESVQLLGALAEAGVDLSRSDRWLTTSEGPLYCATDGEEDEDPFEWRPDGPVGCRAVPASALSTRPRTITGDPPPSFVPPSRRGPSTPLPERPPRTSGWPEASSPTATRIAALLMHHPRLRVVGTLLDDSHALIRVGTVSVGAAFGLEVILTCVASADALRCEEMDLGSPIGVLGETKSGWLVITESGLGDRRLWSVHLASDGLRFDSFSLGWLQRAPAECPEHEEGCVRHRGWATTVRIGGPGYLELRDGPEWSATYIPILDRWVDEDVSEDPGCIRRYAMFDGRFAWRESSPPPAEPFCPAPLPEGGR